jgi:[CysO sulfur-carrier protein]-S-L-cysteine hydrolase
MKSIPRLIVPSHLLDEIIKHCKEEYPNEACGILAGKDSILHKVYKMKNSEQSAFSYMMEPREQFIVMKEMRENGLEMTAVYHSHPYADVYPSPRDINLAFYQDSFYMIVSMIYEEPLIKAFEIKEGMFKEVDMLL